MIYNWAYLTSTILFRFYFLIITEMKYLVANNNSWTSADLKPKIYPFLLVNLFFKFDAIILSI